VFLLNKKEKTNGNPKESCVSKFSDENKKMYLKKGLQGGFVSTIVFLAL